MTGEDPATMRQLQWIKDLGATNIPNDLNRAEASKWIEELQSYDEVARRGSIPEGRIRTDLFERAPTRAAEPKRPVQREVPTGTTASATTGAGTGGSTVSTTAAPGSSMASTGPTPVPVAGQVDTGPRREPAFRTAADMMGASEQGAVVPYEERDEDRGPLTPVQVMTKEEREEFGLGETETVVLAGRQDKTAIVPEYGMPAKYLFARVTINARTHRADVRVFASIEGLVFRANAFSQGIRRLSFAYVDPQEIPGMAAFLGETKDPQIVARANVELGNGTTIVEEGTVRLSEIKLYQKTYHDRQNRPYTKMVSRSPVARTNPLELAKKRALSRALRWGTGFGGTALDELPPAETEGPRERAGLPAEPEPPVPSPPARAPRKKEAGA